jgi:hypothetical protein
MFFNIPDERSDEAWGPCLGNVLFERTLRITAHCPDAWRFEVFLDS